MPQEHVDRLSSIDASVLHREGPNSHIHLGGVLVFEDPPPALPTTSITSAPGCIWSRYRQRVATPPLDLGRPLWIDDPSPKPGVPRPSRAR